MAEWELEKVHEQNRVNELKQKVTLELNRLQKLLGAAGSEIKSIKKNFWDDVTVNLEDAHEAAETHASIKQQSELLSERERRHRHSYEQVKLLNRLKKTPYFGRIDFSEADEKNVEKIYIGIGSFYDEESSSFLVYDWRAPISSVYYDCSVGPASYEAPEGMVAGTLELKRQFVIRNGEIISMFDTGITIGDELLQKVLGKQADTQMKSIVATIQKEQNVIIRNTKSRLLIVQGAAGSGKTSAALQRAAYLLYRFREQLSSEQLLLFSPNPLFNSYVSSVLPELGEANMQQTTFQQYLNQRLGDSFDMEDLFQQMEYVLSSVGDEEYEARLEGIWYKSSETFLQEIDRLLNDLKKAGMIFKPIYFREERILSAEEIYTFFYQLGNELSLPARMNLTADKIRKEVRKRELEERKKPWVEEEMQYLDKKEYLRSYRQSLKNEEYEFNGIDSETQFLASAIVKKRFKSLYKKIKDFAFLDSESIYRKLFDVIDKKELNHWRLICQQSIDEMEQERLFYEDATPYLYLKDQLEGFKVNTKVRYLFIDEAQDYSSFQFAFLSKLFPHCKITILGDPNQTIFAHSETEGIDILPSLFTEAETEKIVLTRSYRSTKEIVQFTREILKDGGSIEPFNRAGQKPMVFTVNDEQQYMISLEKNIHHLQSLGYQNIALIGKTAVESEAVYEALKSKLEIKIVRKGKSEFEEGLLVIPTYLAKGIEFDAVIILNASKDRYYIERERNLFYTSCTRAMHELYLISIGPVSPFISEVSKDLYTGVKGC